MHLIFAGTDGATLGNANLWQLIVATEDLPKAGWVIPLPAPHTLTNDVVA